MGELFASRSVVLGRLREIEFAVLGGKKQVEMKEEEAFSKEVSALIFLTCFVLVGLLTFLEAHRGYS